MVKTIQAVLCTTQILSQFLVVHLMAFVPQNRRPRGVSRRLDSRAWAKICARELAFVASWAPLVANR